MIYLDQWTRVERYVVILIDTRNIIQSLFESTIQIICIMIPSRLSRFSSTINLSSSSQLIDSFGRKHDYLRISLTERCNLRCRYCMPIEGVELTKKDLCLSLTEMQHLSSIFVERCKVRKIRLTGGEPTIDKKLLPLLTHLKALKSSGLETIAMTTNGLTLKRFCSEYKESGE